MRITIISPSSHQVYRNIQRGKKRQPMLGPAYLISSLQQEGHQIQYIDGDALDIIEERMSEEILRTDPQLVGISITTPLFSESRLIARLLRQAGWRGHLLLGGIHPTVLAEETLNLIPEADSILLGEADCSIVEMISTLEKGLSLDTIKGLVFRHPQTKQIIFNPTTELERDLDKLPMPALDYYPMERYISPMWASSPDQHMGVLITSRGCAFQCEFCASGAESLVKLRFHSVDRVMKEIHRLVKEFKVDYLVFNDDTFTVKKKRCIEIFQQMIQDRIDVPFMVTSRVDTVDKEMLTIMKKAGGFLITYGIESGSQDVLDKIGKCITLEKIRESVQIAQDLGLKVVGNYMFGHWYDNLETCQQTLDFAQTLQCDLSQFAITIPYPGSLLHRRAKKEQHLLPTEDYNDYGYYGNVPWIHPVLSKEELIYFQKKAYQLSN